MTFIGPSPSTLRIASDKMLSRDLAISLGVPVAPGKHVSSAESVKAFAHETQVNSTGKVGYPLMIKALDGGGGRGIRVAQHEGDVEEAFKRSSPHLHLMSKSDSCISSADVWEKARRSRSS